MTDTTKKKIYNEYYQEGLSLIEIAKKYPRLTKEEFVKIINDETLS